MGVRTELLCAKEALRVVRRKPTRVVSLYKLSLMGLAYNGDIGLFERIKWGAEAGSVARAIYYALRYVDDILDDDLIIGKDPLVYTNDVLDKLRNRRFSEIERIGDLFAHAVSVLERKSGDNSPMDNIIMELNAMIFDRKRAQNRLALPQAALDDYYWQTYAPIMNITLIGIDSQLRAEDVSELVYGQGRVYSRRDLRDDWSRGLMNIPQEVITQAGLNTASPLQLVADNRFILDWFDSEMIRTQTELHQLQDRLRMDADPFTFKVCNNLIEFNLSLSRPLMK